MLLQTTGLTKLYGTYRALDGLTLALAPGEVLGLLGPNGSGKTTALRLMLGFLRPSAGRASIAGHDCWNDSVEVRKRVAYLPGELRLYENMTGRELIRFLSDLRGQPVKEDLDALARHFDIDINRPLTTLSSGMKRKVALLSVLAPQAPLVIMDEPTNALDPTMRDALLEQVRLAKGRGQAVLFSSHVLAEVEAVADRVAILRMGQLVHEEPLAALKQGRHIVARFEKAHDVVPDLPGLTVLGDADGLALEYTGALPVLLDWLSKQPLRELRMEPLGLRGVYARYHGAEA
jgi:ABC-2 type transport system ATP-binding protein